MHSIDKKNTVKQLVYITDFVFQKAHSKLGFILMLYIIRHTVLFNTKQYSDASSLFQKFLEQNNNQTNLVIDAYLRLADSYLIIKDYNKAILWYNKVISGNSPDADYALLQKAVCYGSQGDFSKKTF